MKAIKNGERCVLPVDPGHMDRRCKELEDICRGIILRLPREEQEPFREYRELLRNQEDIRIQCAFRSGVRAGEKKTGKK